MNFTDNIYQSENDQLLNSDYYGLWASNDFTNYDDYNQAPCIKPVQNKPKYKPINQKNPSSNPPNQTKQPSTIEKFGGSNNRVTFSININSLVILIFILVVVIVLQLANITYKLNKLINKSQT